MNTIRAIVRHGKIEFLEPVEISEGTEVLVMVPSTADNKFWMAVSERSLDAIWKNAGDDVYEQILKV
ncbi:MAG TPA: hypothetical protein VK747_13285 [Blastocatellia bacterium]|nr:hypothetical protein [Blastocatellia bacterium]